jgi:hypothetical protein
MSLIIEREYEPVDLRESKIKGIILVRKIVKRIIN